MVYQTASQRKATTPDGQESSISLLCEIHICSTRRDSLLTDVVAVTRTLPLVSTSLSLSQDLVIPSAIQHTRKHLFRDSTTTATNLPTEAIHLPTDPTISTI
jgi:hypothetical protein